MATTDDNAVFLDTNILVYANVQEAPLHNVALEAIECRYNAGLNLWISRQVLREFLATLSRPQSFSSPKPISTIIDRIHFFQTYFLVADDTIHVTERLLTLLEDIPVGGRQVHDANIVATMHAYGIPHLLTHNTKDFERFSNMIKIIPLEGQTVDTHI